MGDLETAPTKNLVAFYLVIDESYSMTDEIVELNQGMVSMLDQLSSDPFAAAMARITVLGFSGRIDCYLDLADLRDVEVPPEFSAKSHTSYAAVFEDLLDRIPRDVEGLKADGFGVHRPSVFFLTDGQPTDQPDSLWRDPLDDLKDSEFKYHPNIIAFGIGNQVEAKTIVHVASQDNFAWMQAQGSSVGGAIAEFWKQLTSSIVASATAAGAGGEQEVPLSIPEDSFKPAIDFGLV